MDHQGPSAKECVSQEWQRSIAFVAALSRGDIVWDLLWEHCGVPKSLWCAYLPHHLSYCQYAVAPESFDSGKGERTHSSFSMMTGSEPPCKGLRKMTLRFYVSVSFECVTPWKIERSSRNQDSDELPPALARTPLLAGRSRSYSQYSAPPHQLAERQVGQLCEIRCQRCRPGRRCWGIYRYWVEVLVWRRCSRWQGSIAMCQKILQVGRLSCCWVFVLWPWRPCWWLRCCRSWAQVRCSLRSLGTRLAVLSLCCRWLACRVMLLWFFIVFRRTDGMDLPDTCILERLGDDVVKVLMILWHHAVTRLHNSNIFLGIPLPQIQCHLHTHSASTDEHDWLGSLCSSLVVSQEVHWWSLFITGHHGRRCEARSSRYHQIFEGNLVFAFERAVDLHDVGLHACNAGRNYGVIGAVGNICKDSGIWDESFLFMARDNREARLHTSSQHKDWSSTTSEVNLPGRKGDGSGCEALPKGPGRTC